eukprot:TRINITY_DN1871_c1_g1_i1.p1 TRINITY_DN1871_c1_g1~~TRINITY_DN1871_c1_g1_i1.p1  ORF type:complete len:844 (-),score=242.16 TRINITY_DN1871_c1_g1_i1:102-2633(-)
MMDYKVEKRFERLETVIRKQNSVISQLKKLVHRHISHCDCECLNEDNFLDNKALGKIFTDSVVNAKQGWSEENSPESRVEFCKQAISQCCILLENSYNSHESHLNKGLSLWALGKVSKLRNAKDYVKYFVAALESMKKSENITKSKRVAGNISRLQMEIRDAEERSLKNEPNEQSMEVKLNRELSDIHSNKSSKDSDDSKTKNSCDLISLEVINQQSQISDNDNEGIKENESHKSNSRSKNSDIDMQLSEEEEEEIEMELEDERLSDYNDNDISSNVSQIESSNSAENEIDVMDANTDQGTHTSAPDISKGYESSIIESGIQRQETSIIPETELDMPGGDDSSDEFDHMDDESDGGDYETNVTRVNTKAKEEQQQQPSQIQRSFNGQTATYANQNSISGGNELNSNNSNNDHINKAPIMENDKSILDTVPSTMLSPEKRSRKRKRRSSDNMANQQQQLLQQQQQQQQEEEEQLQQRQQQNYTEPSQELIPNSNNNDIRTLVIPSEEYFQKDNENSSSKKKKKNIIVSNDDDDLLDYILDEEVNKTSKKRSSSETNKNQSIKESQIQKTDSPDNQASSSISISLSSSASPQLKHRQSTILSLSSPTPFYDPQTGIVHSRKKKRQTVSNKLVKKDRQIDEFKKFAVPPSVKRGRHMTNRSTQRESQLKQSTRPSPKGKIVTKRQRPKVSILDSLISLDDDIIENSAPTTKNTKVVTSRKFPATEKVSRRRSYSNDKSKFLSPPPKVTIPKPATNLKKMKNKPSFDVDWLLHEDSIVPDSQKTERKKSNDKFLFDESRCSPIKTKRNNDKCDNLEDGIHLKRSEAVMVKGLNKNSSVSERSQVSCI